jgi:alpha-1,6-mannosyltransferase
MVARVLVFRAFELVGVALIMVFLPRLARHLGTDAGVALWLGALSPLALFSFVSSAHNDALMVGLLVAGVTLAVEGRLMVGLAVCALAATVKLPAAIAIVFLVADHLRGGRGLERWREVLWPVVAAVVVFVGVTLACGYGFSWLGPSALHVPTELRILSTPAVSVGAFGYHVLHLFGVPLAQSGAVTVVQTLFGVVALAACVWLILTVHRHEVVRSLGLALLLIVVGSPTVWPWYLLWGLVLLAASSAQRSKVLALVAALAMLLVGPGGTPELSGLWYVVVTLAVAGAVVWLVRDGRWRTVVTGHVG